MRKIKVKRLRKLARSITGWTEGQPEAIFENRRGGQRVMAPCSRKLHRELKKMFASHK